MKKFIYILFFYFFFFSLVSSFTLTRGFAQVDITGEPEDTLLIPGDTLNPDTSLVNEPGIDTSRQKQSDVDAIINYSAKDSAVFNLKDNKLILYNEAELIYKDLKLNSGIIIVDREKENLEAIGFPDSLNPGSYVQTPVMEQGEDVYESVRMTYNFKTGQGNVSMGFTEAEVGYYYGDVIKRVTPQVLFVKNGRYTTSTNRLDPEYYFLSPRMKVIPNDKVIASSVFLYIEGVPVFWIPFAVFPNKSGRSSGIITPSFGDDATYGNYISGLGYFWAINDYFDINATASWFSKGRVDISSRFRYALKYILSGTVEGGYSHIRLGEDNDLDKSGSDEWALNLNHSHTINPTLSVNANMSFVSGKSYYTNSTNNLNELLLQNVLSNVTVTKFWEGTPLSLTLNYYRDQNLQTGDIKQRLPSVNFSISENFPFRSESGSSFKRDFYEDISYFYNLAFVNDLTKGTAKTSSGIDSAFNDNRLGAQNRVTLKYSPKFDFISFSPFFNYTELWYNQSVIKTFNPSDSSVSTNNVNGFKAVRYFNTGVSFNTNFIGIFTPNILDVTGIRHTITPSLTYTYSPDFSAPRFGYYGTYADASGKEIKYSFFEREVYGGAPSTETQSISLNLNNLLEMKTRINDSTENKFQLINFSSGVSYNIAADSLKFSEITNTFRTQIGSFLNIGGSANFNLYKYDDSLNTRINTFLWDGGKIADLTFFNISLSTTFDLLFSSHSGKTVSKDEEAADTNKTKIESVIRKKDEAFYDIPISGSLGYNYTINQRNPENKVKSSNLNGSLNFNITKNWRFSFSTSYDLLSKEIAAPYVTAYRDLNSWEMLFNWYPTGSYRGFKLEIRIKAPDLRDIKIDKESNNRGAFTDF